MATSPTARTLQELKKLGFTAQVVEKFNSFTKRRIDLFGCIDIVAIQPGVGCVGIQATANNGGHHSERLAKIHAEPRMRTWLESGCKLELWSWAKQGARGKRKTWTLRREVIDVNDIVTE